MTYKEIQDLIKLVVKLELAELKLRDGEFEMSVRTKEYARVKGTQTTSSTPVISMAAPAPPPAPEAPPATPQPQAPSAGEKEESETSSEGMSEIKSPIVGTFYRSPSPDKPPFIKVGDVIKAGDVVCIVEAMKLFNEIESEVSGKIVKVLVEDATPVEYDQALFLVDPKG